MKQIGELIKKQGIKRYQGFVKPNTTATPDDLFDVFLSTLTHSELKVLMYIIRRTYGFKKDSDRISLSQICKGIITKENKQLDFGAGLSKQGAITAIKDLEGRGLIKVSRVKTKDGYNKINVYQLRFRGDNQ